MANVIKIKAGSGVPTTSNIVDRELAFNRSNNKLYINDSGTIVDLSGTAGGGSAEEADRVVFNAQAGEALSKGDVIYISGISGNTPIVSKADADDSAKMPAFGLASASASINTSVEIVTFGTLENFDTSSFSVGDTVYVSTTAGGLTATKPTGESGLIQNMGHIVRSHASTGAIKIAGSGRTAATPNLDQDKIFLGNASNQSTPTALSSIGLSKFNNDSGFTTNTGDIEGVTAGNGLTGGGTSGTVTLNHEDTSTQASVNNSGRTYIQDITLDTYGHVTGIATATETVTDTNTVTTNIAGTGVSVSSGTGNSTISIGQSVGTSDTVAFGRVNLGSTNNTTYLTGDSKLSVDGYIMANAIVNTPETGTAPAAITFGDGATLGSDQISLVTAGNRRLYVASNGNVTIAQNLTVNGTIGGSAIKDQDDMSSNSATHLATQQSIKAYVDAEVAGIVNSAPSALNTLDELAAALGDDANFATTTSTSLGNRLRVDTSSQGLTGTQQANAITNLGITATKAELNYVDGVTSAIQTQLNAKLTSSSNLNASNLSSGTVNNARLNTDMELSAAAPRYKLTESDVTNTPTWWMIADGGNYSIRLNNTGAYPMSIVTDSDNDAVDHVSFGYNVSIPQGSRYTWANSHTYISEDADDRLRFFVGGAEFMRFTEDTADSINLYQDVKLTATKKLYLDGGGNSYIQEESADNLIFRAGGGNYLRVTNSNIVLNDPSASYDVRIEGNNDSNLFFTDGSADRVGIGTNSPGELLHVDGSIEFASRKYNTGTVSVAGSGTGNAQSITLSTELGTTLNVNYQYKITLNTIGTGTDTGAVYILTYDNDGGAWDLRFVSRAGSSSNHPLLVVSGSNLKAYHNHSGTYNILYFVELWDMSADDGTLHGWGADYQWQRDVDKLYYNDGFVGIGTSSPDEELHIFGAAPFIKIENSTETSGGILFVDQQDEGQNASIRFDASARSLDFLVDSGEAMTILGTANARRVGIGETSPISKLHVQDANDISMASTGIGQMSVEGNGYTLGIALNGSGAFIYHNSSSRFLSLGTNETEQVRLTTGGALHVVDDVVAFSSTPSDKRLKTNVKDIDYGLDTIMKLKPKQYDWKKDDRHDIGFIAQEVEEVIPEIVKDNEWFDDKVKTLDYEKLTAVLIKAVQELKTEIEELKK